MNFLRGIRRLPATIRVVPTHCLTHRQTPAGCCGYGRSNASRLGGASTVSLWPAVRVPADHSTLSTRHIQRYEGHHRWHFCLGEDSAALQQETPTNHGWLSVGRAAAKDTLSTIRRCHDPSALSCWSSLSVAIATHPSRTPQPCRVQLGTVVRVAAWTHADVSFRSIRTAE